MKASKVKQVLSIMVSIVIVVLLAFVILFFSLRDAEKKTEKAYAQALEVLASGDYTEARNQLQKIGYEDSNILAIYCEAEISYAYGDYYYSKTVALLEDIPEDYIGLYSDQIKQLRADATAQDAAFQKRRQQEKAAESKKENSTSTTNSSGTSSGHHSSSGSSSSSSSSVVKDADPYDVQDYSNEEDFYYDNIDDFVDYEEAEDYFNEYGE